MADTCTSTFISQKNTEKKKRRHSYSVSRANTPPPNPIATSKRSKVSRWSHIEEDSQDTGDVRKRSKSFLDYFKSRRNFNENSVENEAKRSSSSNTTRFERKDECIRVVITALDPQMNYKTISITPSTTAHEVVATLVKKFSTESKTPSTFYLTEVRESDQGSYSRLLEDNEKVHDIQKKWLNGRLCYFEICRKQHTLVSHDDFIDNGPIHAIVLSPSQDSFYSQECNSPVSLSEFMFPTTTNNTESKTPEITSTGELHRHIRNVNAPQSPSDTSEAGSVDMYTTPVIITSEQPDDIVNVVQETTHSDGLSKQTNHSVVESETVVPSKNISKQTTSLDQFVQQSVRQDSPVIGGSGLIQPTFKRTNSPNQLHLPHNGQTLLYESPKVIEDAWFLKSLVCSPVNPQGKKTLPRFVFATSSDVNEDSLVVQHTTALLKCGQPHRRSKTSRLLTEVTFETCLTIYPKFQTTASLFPSFAHNMLYDTEMNIFEPLAKILESKINQATNVHKNVQNQNNDNNDFCNLHITGGNKYTPQSELESDTSGIGSPTTTELESDTSGIRSPTTVLPLSLPTNIQTDKYYHRRGMVVRHLQGTMPDRAYSRSTTCISSEVQSDLDAVISQRQLHEQLINNSESSISLHYQSQSTLALSQSSPQHPYHAFSTTELFSPSNTIECRTQYLPQSGGYSSASTPEHLSLRSLKTFKSLEKIHQQRQGQHERSSSEILLTFTNNQRPITVFLRSKSSIALHKSLSDNQQDSDTTHTSSTCTDLNNSSTETFRPRKRPGRPTSAPHRSQQQPQPQHGSLAGLMDSIHQKADKKWWTEM